MRKTAIDYLVEELTSNGGVIYVGQIKKAKEMEKQQILDAHRMSSIESGFEHSAEDWANTYYNETYKNK